MPTKLSFAEKIVLAIMEDTPKGAMNAARVLSRIPADAKLNSDIVYKALLTLSSKGLVSQVSKGNFKFKHPLQSITGIAEYTKGGDAYILADKTNLLKDDIFIPKEWLNRALPGDLVECELVQKGSRPKGKITRVLERAVFRIVGILDVFESNAFLVPDKKNFPFDIKIRGKVESDWDGLKAVVSVVDFPAQSKNPIGVIVEILGKQGTNDAEMHSIVAEFGFAVQFPDAVLAEVSNLPEVIESEKHAEDRRDFRNTLTFTIDPADAKDFDDAISYKALPDGKIELGVHIADVSYYVQPNTAVDREAFTRGTSVYLADRTIPMLPEVLSNHLCSLKPDVDRLAFSAVFIMDDNGTVSEKWFGKTLIHSVRRFSYEEAQERIVSHKGDYAEELDILNNIAKKLFEKRKKNGALGFESDEIRFEMDAHGKPLKVILKKRFDAHKLIEEYMLLANRLVAEFVKTKQKPELPFIYRFHDNPSPEKMVDLAKFCQLFGYRIDINSEKNLRHSLNQLLIDVQGKPEEDVVNQMAIRSMAKAIYTGTHSDHFGLAFDYYTHFTSPIRRYPDLLVHRMLEHYLKGEKGGYTEDQIEFIAKQSSNMEQKAAEAERASTKYKMAEYLQQHIGQTFEAVVSGVTEWGIFAEIIENHCEGMIRISDMRGDNYMYLEKERKVVGKRTRRTFQLGDMVTIRVKNANPNSRLIDFVMEE